MGRAVLLKQLHPMRQKRRTLGRLERYRRAFSSAASLGYREGRENAPPAAATPFPEGKWLPEPRLRSEVPGAPR